MNLLIKNQRELLPQDKRLLIETKEKISKRKQRVTITVCGLAVVALGVILFPELIQKTAPIVAPIYGQDKPDNIIHEGFQIKKVSGTDLLSVLNQNHIQDARIASQKQIAELIVQPQVNEQSVTHADGRILLLRNYLIAHGSPMVSSAATFISVADQLHINWKLLPAIAGTESGFGKVIPLNANGSLSYNPFGWGVYGSLSTSFSSWDEAIRTVGAGIVKAYGTTNLTPAMMEATYTPPSYYGDHHWRFTVQEFMSEL